MGDRLAFSHGIIAVAVVAAAVLAGFRGKVEALIPLYAVGVFLAFTLAQTGMVVHWRRHRDRHWRKAAVTNAVGAMLSAIVLAVTAITKFTHGAWLVVCLIPLIVWCCRKIHAHYQYAHNALIPSADDRYRGYALAPRCLAPQPRPAPEDLRPEHATDPREICNLVVVAVAAIDARACTHSPMPPHWNNLRSPCTSAPTNTKPTAFTSTGRHGAITCPSRSSSRPTALPLRPSLTTSRRCTTSDPRSPCRCSCPKSFSQSAGSGHCTEAAARTYDVRCARTPESQSSVFRSTYREQCSHRNVNLVQ